MTIDEEVRRATKLLETVMQAAGLTRKDLDQKLGAGPGYVSQVLTGRMELKYRHILAILRALDVDPGVFFQTLYPESKPSSDVAMMEEFLKRFQKLGFGRPPEPVPPPPSARLDSGELEKLIQNAVRAALSDEGGPPRAGKGRGGKRTRTTEDD
ncbi:MAG TPA: helix-turn-helix transcriptional regulator [Thermoanaerobaculia bacterium]|nr:helix-turn-helix transcriptional regulator [Thermoanaerobaculia bacterium]